MASNIFKQVKKEIHEFQNSYITIVPGYTFNQKKTIERIYHYYNSHFESGDIDSEGFKKYFFNIVRNPCYVATKTIDFDTKDIVLEPEEGYDEWTIWLMERDLKNWMKRKNFGKLLNDIFFYLPIFGSVVLKKVRGNFYLVDLRNLVNEQSADTLRDAAYVIEFHHYTPEEFRETAQELNWENVEEVIKTWEKTNVSHIRIIERYGLVPASWLGQEGGYVYSRFILYIPENKTKSDIKEGIILHSAQIDRKTEFPYREIHWEKIPGRWLGIGRVEILFDPQIRTNELMNLRVKASYFAALNIYQTSDELVQRNLLTDVKQGEILFTRTGITRVPTEERNLAAFENEQTRWLNLRDELTMTFDILRGERLPGRMPLGVATLISTQAASYFDQIRENVALAIKELLYNDVIPQFLAEQSKEHYLHLVGEDLEKWKKSVYKARLFLALIEFLRRKRRMPTPAQFAALKVAIKRQVEKERPWIPPEYYKDVKYRINIIITGEAKDIRVEAANLQTILQAIVADPTLITDPVKRKIFARIAAKGGINLADILPAEEEKETEIIAEAVKKGGGGVSRPSLPPTPILGEGEAQI